MTDLARQAWDHIESLRRVDCERIFIDLDRVASGRDEPRDDIAKAAAVLLYGCAADESCEAAIDRVPRDTLLGRMIAAVYARIKLENDESLCAAEIAAIGDMSRQAVSRYFAGEPSYAAERVRQWMRRRDIAIWGEE